MNNDEIPEQDTILFHITRDQAQTICEHFGVDLADLEEYEIAELLDRIIDEEI